MLHIVITLALTTPVLNTFTMKCLSHAAIQIRRLKKACFGGKNNKAPTPLEGSSIKHVFKTDKRESNTKQEWQRHGIITKAIGWQTLNIFALR